MFKDFGKRLQRDVKAIVDGRIAGSEEKSGGYMKVSLRSGRVLHGLKLVLGVVDVLAGWVWDGRRDGRAVKTEDDLLCIGQAEAGGGLSGGLRSDVPAILSEACCAQVRRKMRAW